MRLAIINKGTLISNDEAATMAEFEQVAIEDLALAYDFLTPDIVFAVDESKLDPETDPVYIFDDADQAGALGYHDLTPTGEPYAKVFSRLVLEDENGCKFIGKDPTDTSLSSVMAVLDHECKELVLDPYINDWVDCAIVDPQSGASYSSTAKEACDAVQGGSYVVELPDRRKALCSDFLLPSWFDPSQTTGPYNHLGTLKAPFTVDVGGYCIVRSASGDANQIFGHPIPGSKMKYSWRSQAPHPSSRTARRLKRK